MEVGGGGDETRQPKEMKSPLQLEILKEAFAVEPRPSAETRAELAERTGLPLEKVSMWFATTRFSSNKPRSGSYRRRPGRPPLPPPSGPGESSAMGSLGRGLQGSRRRRPRKPPLPPPEPSGDGVREAMTSGPGEGSAAGSLGKGIDHCPHGPQRNRQRSRNKPPLLPRQPSGNGVTVAAILGSGESSDSGSIRKDINHRSFEVKFPPRTQARSPGSPPLSPPQPLVASILGPDEDPASGSIRRDIDHRPIVTKCPPRFQVNKPDGPPLLSPPSGNRVTVATSSAGAPFVPPESMFTTDPGTTRCFIEPTRPPQPFMQQPLHPIVQPPVFSLSPHPPQLWMHQPLPQMWMPILGPMPQTNMGPLLPLQKPMMPEQQQQLFPHLYPMLPMPLLPQYPYSQHTVEEGPVYAVEFDPLPPGAFGAPIGEQEAPPQSSDHEALEAQLVMTVKASTSISNMGNNFVPRSSNEGNPAIGGIDESHLQVSQRALQEYKFLPEKPSLHVESYEKVETCPSSGGNFFHGNAKMASSYSYQGQISTSFIQSQDNAKEVQYDISTVIGPENHIPPSNERIFFDDRSFRMERIRKGKFTRCEGERIALEFGASGRPILDQLGKQDSIEKMRIELIAHNCEKEKAVEGLLPEKQKGGEFQMDKYNEYDPSKIMQKEIPRLEELPEEAVGPIAVDGNVVTQRISPSYTGLIEDEHLELMRLAATSKGLSSISSLDIGTLQQLNLFKDMISTFPPTSVQLKRPFSVLPWTESEENIGNLLMVWKFITTFADVLELWPFTIDEFVQSLHDYDSRLLGEVHVALLKYILKEVENGSNNPAFALRANKISVNGLQKQIVEGASAWGFDICKWKRHMNFLTWPEIFRQLALSIGFGPRLKKINADNKHVRDNNEGNNAGDAVSSLRNGAIAENADTSIREKGLSHQNQSRFRLTPGTIKFAAFHVLSLEGKKGLRLTEIVEKIQTYGLRDITNKAPEATVATVLSREAKLFERVGPSTYCVRPSFRKDAADADVVLSSARERILFLKSGRSESKRAVKHCEDEDDGEDSDCDGADDPESDNCAPAKIDVDISTPVQLPYAKESSFSENKKRDVPYSGVGKHLNGVCKNVREGFSSLPHQALGRNNHRSLNNASNFHGTSNDDHKETKIEENDLGEPWVQGLTEGNYSGLSAEERLNALVALIGLATEGNLLHNVLEERVKAANALKKLMWAEAKQEKRHLKEEMDKLHHSSSIAINSATEVSRNPLQCLDHSTVGNHSTVVPRVRGSFIEMSTLDVKSYIHRKAEEVHAYRFLPLGEDRRRNRYWQFSTSASANEPGSGRIFFESNDGFWRLIDSKEAFDALLDVLDTRGIRESRLHSALKKIEKTFKEASQREKNSDSEDSAAAPDCSKSTEGHCRAVSGFPLEAMEHSASFSIELGLIEPEKIRILKRYEDFVRWMWRGSFNAHILCAMKHGTKRCAEIIKNCDICYHSYLTEEKHCPSCHATFEAWDADFPQHLAKCEPRSILESELKFQNSESSLPVNVRLLKVHLALIEVSIPEKALQPFWSDDCRKSWVVKLRTLSSAEDLLQILTLLERAIKPELLSPDFETSSELLGVNGGLDVQDIESGSVPVLPWIPNTAAAVAFRLLALDASIPYALHQNTSSDEESEAEDFMILPRDVAFKDIQQPESTKNLNPVDHQKDRQWLDNTGGRRGIHTRRGRGRGGRGGGRGGRGRGKPMISTGTSETDPDDEKPVIIKRGPGRPRGGGRGRGLHQSRPHKRSRSTTPVLEDAVPVSFNDFEPSAKEAADEEESSSSSGGDKWVIERSRTTDVKVDTSVSGSSEDSEEDEDRDRGDIQMDISDDDEVILDADEETTDEDEEASGRRGK